MVEVKETKNEKKKKDLQAMGPWRVAWERFRKNKLSMAGAIIFFSIVILVILVPIISPYSLHELNLPNKLQPPSGAHWLGTDEQGRDVLMRVFYGGRISMIIGVLTAGVTVLLGATMGGIAGYYGGWVDNILMRITEIVYSLPFYPLVITLSFVLMWRVSSSMKMYIVMFILDLPEWLEDKFYPLESKILWLLLRP